MNRYIVVKKGYASGKIIGATDEVQAIAMYLKDNTIFSKAVSDPKTIHTTGLSKSTLTVYECDDGTDYNVGMEGAVPAIKVEELP